MKIPAAWNRFGMAVTIAAMASAESAPAPATRQLIRDPHFRRGFFLLKAKPGKVVSAGEWRFREDQAPVWRLPQWSSRFPIEDTPSEVLPHGVFRRKNAGKMVQAAPPGAPDADLILAVNGDAEYAGKARKKGQPWVHLLVSQRFKAPPRMNRVSRVRFRISARLLYCRRSPTAHYDPRIHAAQFLAFLIIQNLNRTSKGYGDYLYFGIPLYDNRRPYPLPFHAPDSAGKFIFSPGGKVYADKPMGEGEWVTVDKDVLPLIIKGLNMAWNRGFLKESHTLGDYRIAGMNLGWEVPGVFDVSAQVRDLALFVTLAPAGTAPARRP